MRYEKNKTKGERREREAEERWMLLAALNLGPFKLLQWARPDPARPGPALGTPTNRERIFVMLMPMVAVLGNFP